MGEKKEALIRIPVGIVSCIVISLWKALVQILVIFHFFVVLFTGKRNKGLADFVEMWNTQVYVFLKYVTFVSNIRPFPFNKLQKNLSKFGK